MKYLIALMIIVFVFRWFLFGFWRGFWDAVNGKPYDDEFVNEENKNNE